MYLFDNYVDQPKQRLNSNQIADGMLQAGFHLDELDRAINWLDGLNNLQHDFTRLAAPGANSFRIYAPEECVKISQKARAYLMFLEQADIVDAGSRELIINRAMALDDNAVDLSALKWIVLMVLFNKPSLKDKLVLMEELVFNEGAAMH